MPTVTVGDIAEMTVKYGAQGQQMLSRIYIGARANFTGGSEGQDELQEFADALKNLLRMHQFQDIVWTTWSARQVRGAGVTYTAGGDQVGGWQAEGNLTGTLTGNSAVGEMLPLQVSTLISWKTGFSGRSWRGRTYTSGVSTNESANGLLDSGIATARQGELNTFLGLYGFGGTDLDWAVGVFSHRIATGKKLVYNTSTGAGTLTPTDTPSPNTAWKEFTSGTVQRTLMTQRRRRLGVGI